MDIERLHAKYGDAEKCIDIMQEHINKMVEWVDIELITNARMGALKRDLPVADREMHQLSGRAKCVVTQLNNAIYLHGSDLENKRLHVCAKFRCFVFHLERMGLGCADQLIKATLTEAHLNQLAA